ncbi:leucine-rich repeats and guanylate kinase domain containing protein [Reticulomyxa filosa]|uniref:Leucine-rich repeats and guanylate kinase domain containing protein n=1 Tax=Reticulomyxa filosa TaxID=46433 RepID=X6MJP6_RETFI|nr:leucine-rich repeats and guanylate kinase domain containing protein [Reticulomyxa filosa]|eukprot:ETO14238.1 leucine-rich repeats and guanylate kinase domain containing protein [Reticulomyxa filosa]
MPIECKDWPTDGWYCGQKGSSDIHYGGMGVNCAQCGNGWKQRGWFCGCQWETKQQLEDQIRVLANSRAIAEMKVLLLFFVVAKEKDEELKRNEEEYKKKMEELKRMDEESEQYRNQILREEKEINKQKEEELRRRKELEQQQREREEALRKVEPPAAGQVFGIVCDSRGNGIKGLSIELWNDKGMIPVESDAEGRFIYTNLSPGEYTIRIDDNAWTKQNRVICIPDGGSITEEITLSRTKATQSASDTEIKVTADSKADITVAANSLKNLDGTPYFGKVNVFTATIDATSPAQVRTMPHFRTSIDPNGPLLETGGAIFSVFTDESGRLLEATNVRVTIPLSKYDPDMGLWYMGLNDRVWRPLKNVTRRSGVLSGTFSGSGWVNADKRYPPKWRNSRLTDRKGRGIPFATVTSSGVGYASNYVTRTDRKGCFQIPSYKGRDVQLDISLGHDKLSDSLQINPLKNEPISLDIIIAPSQSQSQSDDNLAKTTIDLVPLIPGPQQRRDILVITTRSLQKYVDFAHRILRSYGNLTIIGQDKYMDKTHALVERLRNQGVKLIANEEIKNKTVPYVKKKNHLKLFSNFSKKKKSLCFK